MNNIKSIDDIAPGHLPGFFFPKLIELGHLIIEPFSDKSLANICYYLHFNNKFRKPKRGSEQIDLLSKESIEDAFEPYVELERYLLEPGQSVIGQTYEKVGISEWLLCKLENPSPLGRVFLNHASHGFLHPGHGIKEPFHLMVELTNLGQRPVEIVPAHLEEGVVKGPEVLRMYVEKLPYPAQEYRYGSSIPRLRMDGRDRS